VSRPRTVVIGLTGPIGCGKSTVAGWLEELGGVVVDADRIARQVTAPGEPALDAVIEAFGEEFMAGDGSLDRAALGRVVFSDPAALARLEAIVHPAVRPRIDAAVRAATESGVPLVAIEAIKLVEAGHAARCDEVWLVTCDAAAQRERLVGRGTTPADATTRIGAQGDIVQRLRPAATRVIDTSGDRASVRDHVRAIATRLLGGRDDETADGGAEPPG
jgi:dephospho-CoA kinase